MREMIVSQEIECGIFTKHPGLRHVAMVAAPGAAMSETVFAPQDKWGTFFGTILKQLKDMLPAGFVSGEPGVISTDGMWLATGARVYVDMQHTLEIALPECPTFADLCFQRNVAFRLVAEVLARSRAVFRERDAYEGPCELLLCNTAKDPDQPRKHNTWGAHGNFLLRCDLLGSACGGQTTTAIGQYLHRHAGAFFASLPILSGSGYLSPEGTFHLSARQHFMCHGYGSGTTQNRAILVIREQEAHANPQVYLRLQCLSFDTHLTDRVLRMTFAFTYWVLRLIERGWRAPEHLEKVTFLDSDFLAFLHAVNADPLLAFREGSGENEISALSVLQEYYAAVGAYRSLLLFTPEDEEIFREVGLYLEAATAGPSALVGISEWATKFFWLEKLREKNGFSDFNNPRCHAFSSSFHRTEPRYAKMREELFGPSPEIPPPAVACGIAPHSRAFIRGLAVRLAPHLHGASKIVLPPGDAWTSLRIIHPGTEGSIDFKLNQDQPWDLREEDVVSFLKRVAPSVFV